jgi:hypothetical protein
MNTAELPAVGSAGRISKLLARIAGADWDSLRSCPQRDCDNVRAVAEIMICTWLYQTVLLSLISHSLFSAQGLIRPEIVLSAAFIATFILLIDSYMVMRAGWHLSGLAELKRGGLDIFGGFQARFKAAVFLAIRIALALGIAQLTAIFVSVLVLGSDIDARIEQDFLHANAALIAAATVRADTDIQRTRDREVVEAKESANLAAQAEQLRKRKLDMSEDPPLRQAQGEVAQVLAAKAKADDELQSAQVFADNEVAGIKAMPGNSGQFGEGIRYRIANERVANAKTRVAALATSLDAARARVEQLQQQIGAQLATVDSSLTEQNAKLAATRPELTQLVQNRESAISKAVETEPSYVTKDTGFLARIVALKRIAADDREIAIVILLIELTSFAFELAAVLVKVTSFVPTTYATLLARDAYLRAVVLARRLAEELEMDIDKPANDNQGEPFVVTPAFVEPETPPDPSPPSPKRPRGRPRKVPGE